MCMRINMSYERWQQFLCKMRQKILHKIEERIQSRINPKRWNLALINQDYDDGKEPSFDDNGFWIADGELRYYKGDDVAVSIPASVTSICGIPFFVCKSLTEIHYAGTKEQWKAVTEGDDWHKDIPVKSISCSDGELSL